MNFNYWCLSGMVFSCTFLVVIAMESPLASVVDIINDFSICILQVLANPNSNTVFSPYGLVSVIVLIHEGANTSSHAAKQIEQSLRLPRHRDLTQLGFRDLHRYLKSYFTSDGFLRGLVLSNPKAVLSQSYLRTLKYYGFEPDVSIETTTFTSTPKDQITIQNITSTASPVKNRTETNDIDTRTQNGDRVPDKNLTTNDIDNRTQNGDRIPDKNVTFVKPKNVTTINKGIITPMHRPTTKLKQTTIQSIDPQSILTTTEEVICPTLDTSIPLPTRINFETTIEPGDPVTPNFFHTSTTETTTRYKPETEPTTTKKVDEGPLITTAKTPTTVIKKSTASVKPDKFPTDTNEILETASSLTSPPYSATERTTDLTEAMTGDFNNKNTDEDRERTTKITIDRSSTGTTVAESTTEPTSTKTESISTERTLPKIPSSASTSSLITSSSQTISSDKHFNEIFPSVTVPEEASTDNLTTTTTTEKPTTNMFEEEYIHMYDNEDEDDKIEPKNIDASTSTTDTTSSIESRTEGIVEAKVEEMTTTEPPKLEDTNKFTEQSTTEPLTTIEEVEAKVEEMITTGEPMATEDQTKSLKDFSTSETTTPAIQTMPITSSNFETETSTNQMETTTTKTETTTLTIDTTATTDTVKIQKESKSINETVEFEARNYPENEKNVTDNYDETLKMLREGFDDILNLTLEGENITKDHKLDKFMNTVTEEQDEDMKTTLAINYTTLDKLLFSDWITEPTTLLSIQNDTESAKDSSTEAVTETNTKKTSDSRKAKKTSFFDDYLDQLNIELNKTNATDFPEYDLYFSDDTERLVNVSSVGVNLTDYFNDDDSNDYKTASGRSRRSINGRFRMANWLEGTRYRNPSNQWFTSFSGENLVPVLTVKAFLPYADIPSLGAQALQIPLDVDYYTMLILLPKHRMGLKQLLNALQWCSIRNLIASLRTTPVYAVLPTFSLVHHVNLVNPLIKLGIRDIFDARKADLTEMSRDPNLHVRSIEQVVTMSVREHYHNNNQHRWYDATETQIQQQFLATHPFVFFVIDTETKVSLVAGTMIDPSLRSTGN